MLLVRLCSSSFSAASGAIETQPPYQDRAPLAVAPPGQWQISGHFRTVMRKFRGMRSAFKRSAADFVPYAALSQGQL